MQPLPVFLHKLQYTYIFRYIHCQQYANLGNIVLGQIVEGGFNVYDNVLDLERQHGRLQQVQGHVGRQLGAGSESEILRWSYAYIVYI